MASIAAGTVISAISNKGKTVSFKKSGGSSAGTKAAIEAAVKSAFEGSEYADPDLVTALAVALHGGTSKKPMSITLEEAQTKLKEILDNPRKRAAPVKKAAGEAAAAPAPKKGDYTAWTKEVKAGLGEGEPFDSIIAGAVWRNSTKNYEASKAEAIRQMKEKAPEKAAAAVAKLTEAQRAAAEAKAVKEAEREAERQRKAAELAARKLGGPAGPAGAAGPNTAWAAEVEEEYERCVAACEATKAEKLAVGRAAYTRKRATAKAAGPAGAAAANNSGESLSEDEAWTKFTEGLPADIAAFVSTSKQKASLLKTPQFKAWVLVYASSVSKGTTELNKYRESIKKAVGKKLEAAKAALAAAAGNGGAARKRRASGGSRKNRSSRKNRKTRRRRN